MSELNALPVVVVNKLLSQFLIKAALCHLYHLTPSSLKQNPCINYADGEETKFDPL